MLLHQQQQIQQNNIMLMDMVMKQQHKQQLAKAKDVSPPPSASQQQPINMIPTPTHDVSYYMSTSCPSPHSPCHSGSDGGQDYDSDQDGMGTKKRGQYTKRACVNCRVAHAACDSGRPCKRCVLLGKTNTCTDAGRKRARKRPLGDGDDGFSSSESTSNATGVLADGFFPSMADYLPFLENLSGEAKNEAIHDADGDDDDNHEKIFTQQQQQQPKLVQLGSGDLVINGRNFVVVSNNPTMMNQQPSIHVDEDLKKLENKLNAADIDSKSSTSSSPSPTLNYLDASSPRTNHHSPSLSDTSTSTTTTTTSMPIISYNNKQDQLLDFGDAAEFEDDDNVLQKNTQQPSFQPHQMHYDDDSGDESSPTITSHSRITKKKKAIAFHAATPSPTLPSSFLSDNKLQIAELQKQLKQQGETNHAVLDAISQAQNEENNDELVKVLLLEYMRQSSELKELKMLVQHLQNLVISSSLTSYVGMKDSMPNISRVSNNL
ncbi:transcription activator of gluconeogenesis ERT1 [Acrasis kona]|uniref:Transcription activator of gluconeogenesis ERT1 n=1 Tax=Acrasis kona TaxID=1008807 RepID=A0AAW2YWV5_9EUKA